MGNYGINRKTVEEITEDDCDKMMIETTKIIEARENAREVAIAFFDRAWVYTERQRYNEAISDLTSAIKIAPEFAGAYANRGFSYYKINQFDKALSDFKMALKFFSINDDCHEEIEKTKVWIKKMEKM